MLDRYGQCGTERFFPAGVRSGPMQVRTLLSGAAEDRFSRESEILSPRYAPKWRGEALPIKERPDRKGQLLSVIREVNLFQRNLPDVVPFQ